MLVKAKCIGLLLPLLLAGCVIEDESNLINVQWPEQRVVFVADARVGTVQALTQNSPANLLAETGAVLPSSVRSMLLDKEHDRLWVLGSNGIDVLDAHSLELKKHIALKLPATAASLKRDPSGVSLYSVSGALLGRIDCHTLVTHWRSGAGTLANQG